MLLSSHSEVPHRTFPYEGEQTGVWGEKCGRTPAHPLYRLGEGWLGVVPPC
jgi:hypothetical protein